MTDATAPTEGAVDHGLVVVDALPLVPALIVDVPTHANPAREYIASLPSDESKRTMTSSLVTITGLLGTAVPEGTHWQRVPWHHMRAEHAAALRSRILTAHPTPATSGRLLAALRGVFRASWRARYITEDDRARAVDALKAGKGSRGVAGRYVESRDVLKLFAVAESDGDTPRGVRERAMLVLLFVGALRRAEVASLRVDGIDHATCTVKLIGKGNKEREVPIAPETWGHIERWLALRGPGDGPVMVALAPKGNVRRDPLVKLTPNAVYKALSKLGERSGVEVSPHDARRTRITDLLAAGLDLLSTSRFAGHDNAATTKIYDRRPAQRLAEDVARIGSTLDGRRG